MHPYHEAVRPSGERTLTVFLPSGPLVLNNDHPQYPEVFAAARQDPTVDPQEILRLVDLSVAVSERFDPLSERISVSGGTVYFDGDPIHNSLAKHIVRALEDGSDFMPLVRFFEKLATNPNEHSREQLYDWLDRRDFSVAPDGDFLAYKGCAGSPDAPVSVHRGPAIVDGERVNGAVPNTIGSVVEIGRSQVTFDPSQGCSSGLHVGSFDYAKGWAQGVLLLVKVNPRDVVSVPTDSDWAKVRVSRYEVVDAYRHAQPIQSAVYSELDEDWYGDEDEDCCGDPDCDYCA